MISGSGEKDTPTKSCRGKSSVRKKSSPNMTSKSPVRSMASYLILRSYVEIWIWPLASAVSEAKLHNNEEKRNNWFRDGAGMSSQSCWSKISTTLLCMACVEHKWHVTCQMVTSSKRDTQFMRNFWNKTKQTPKCIPCYEAVVFVPNKSPSSARPTRESLMFLSPIFRGVPCSPCSGTMYKASLLSVSIVDRKYMQ